MHLDGDGAERGKSGNCGSANRDFLAVAVDSFMTSPSSRLPMSFVELLCASLPAQPDTVRDQLAAIQLHGDPKILAWAVNQAVMANRKPDEPLGEDLVQVSKSLCVHTNANQLMEAWLQLYCARVGRQQPDVASVRTLIEMSAISITTPDGFECMARSLASDGGIRVSTERTESPLRPSTPPVVVVKRVATPPSAMVEQALQ